MRSSRHEDPRQSALVVQLADETRVHFLIDPRLPDRLRRQQHEEMRAITNTFIDLLPQTVTRIDAPAIPPGFNGLCLECFGNPARKFEIV